jgi:hypothetical protein
MNAMSSASPPGMAGRSVGPRAGIAPALVSLALALGACGGDDGGSVTTDVDELVPSKRDYIIQADTICSDAEQRIQTELEAGLGISSNDFRLLPSGEIVFKPGRRPSDDRIQSFGTDVAIPNLREQLADLRALTPPTGDEQAVAEIYDQAQQGLDRLADDPALFNDQGAVRRALTEARRLGRRYGFFECGTYSGP